MLLAWAALAWVGFLATLLLLPGLRGAASGLGAAINAVSSVGAVVAQLLAILGLVLVVHLELVLLRVRVPWLVRVASVPTTAVAATLLMNASVDGLTPFAVLVLTASAGILALVVGAVNLSSRKRSSAWAGTLLVTVGSVSLLSLGARVATRVAVERRTEAAEVFGRSLATAAFVLSVALLATVLWHRARLTKRGWHTLAALLAASLLWTWVAARASEPDVPHVVVLLARAALASVRAPLPYLPVVVVTWGQLLAFAAAAWVLTTQALPRYLRVIVALSLLSLLAPDVPLLSLGLVLASLVAAVVYAPRASAASSDALSTGTSQLGDP